MAAVGVLLFKGGARAGPRVQQSELQARFGYPHTEGGQRGCAHKAVHTQGGLWPPQESCYLRGVRGLAPASSEAGCLSSEASRNEGPAVHTQRGSYTRWFMATARVLLFKGGARAGRRVERSELFVERSEPKKVEGGTEEGGGYGRGEVGGTSCILST